MKTCTDCKKDKNLDEFYFRNSLKGYRQSKCKECFNLINKEYRKNNKDKIKKIKKRERVKNEDNYRNRNYKRLYGITLKQYNKMLKDQNYKCAICNSNKTARKNNRLDVDHCHTTGKVRKLLCSSCNKLISNCKEDTNILKNAIEYLNQ